MDHEVNLSGSWAKLKRAKAHIDAFHAAVEKKLGPHPINYGLASKFDCDHSAFIFYIERLVEIDDCWSLIVGDAIHNLRCALDHLAWQLALRRSGGIEPQDPNSVQFPIETDSARWPRKFFKSADSAKLEDLQPFNEDTVATGMRLPHPLVMLRSLSNTDKHRAIEVTSHYPSAYSMGQIVLERCLFHGGDIILNAFATTPKEGDEVFRIPVTVTGDNPTVRFEGDLSCYVAVRERWNIEDVMTLIYKRTETLLRRFSA